jgi:hypothetical protein
MWSAWGGGLNRTGRTNLPLFQITDFHHNISRCGEAYAYNEEIPSCSRRTKSIVKQPPVLFEKTQSIVREIEKIVDGTFIAYWNNPKGSVCQNDVIAFHELLEKIGRRDKIYLFHQI